jgi:hypothetical protein
VICPKEEVAMADSPFGYIDKGDWKKEELFKKPSLAFYPCRRGLIPKSPLTGSRGSFRATTSRFEKKTRDLKLSKTISMRMAPQIRLVQIKKTFRVLLFSAEIVRKLQFPNNPAFSAAFKDVPAALSGKSL